MTQEAQYEAAVRPFGEAEDVSVKQDQPAVFAKLKVMVETGNVTSDVMDLVPSFVLANCGTLFEPLDKSIVDVSRVPAEKVSECAAPAYNSAFMWFYDTATFPNGGPSTWADFFDVERFPGKRGIPEAAEYGLVEAALLADGVEPATLYPLDYDRAFKKLDSIEDELVFWSSGAQQQQQMESGEVAMMFGWPGRAHGAAVNGASFVPVWETVVGIYDVFTVVKGSPNAQTAMEFINYAISAKPQEEFATRVPYASINLDSQEPDDELIASFAPTLAKQERFGFVDQDQQWWSENLDDVTARWAAWVSG